MYVGVGMQREGMGVGEGGCGAPGLAVRGIPGAEAEAVSQSAPAAAARDPWGPPGVHADEVVHGRTGSPQKGRASRDISCCFEDY